MKRIEKTGLILDRLIMQSPELSSNTKTGSRSGKFSIEVNISQNEEFRSYLKNVNLLLYLKYPSVVKLTSWHLIEENNVIKATNYFASIKKDFVVSEDEYAAKNQSNDKNATEKKKKLCTILSEQLDDEISPINKIILIYGIARAICYFQSKFVVHNKLEAKNIYIKHKNGYMFPKITNFCDSTIFYDPSQISLENFSKDVEDFSQLITKIGDKCKEKDSDLDTLINQFKESNSDPVTRIRQFVKDIENGNFQTIKDQKDIFDKYKNDFDTFKTQKISDDSSVLEIIQNANDKNSNELPIEMVKKLFDKSKQGNCTADFNLGICYLKGIGIPKNFGIGYYYISKAAQKLPFARILRLILENQSSVESAKETSTSLYQKAQIYEWKKDYQSAIESYIGSIKKAYEERKSYTPSIGRLGRLLTCRRDKLDEFAKKGVDYLKIGYDNEDPYATFELFCFFNGKFRSGPNVPTSPNFEKDPAFDKFRTNNKGQIVYNKQKLCQHFYDKAVSLGLLVNEIKSYQK